MTCHGNGDHCCYIGGVCPYLEEHTVPGRRWACGLLRKLGTWDAVHDSPEWQVLPVAEWFARWHPGYGCGDWPQGIPGEMTKPNAGLCCYG